MKRTIFTVVFSFIVAGALLMTGQRAYAHHSFAATYFVDQTVTVKGTLTQFLFRNPHSFVKMSEPNGTVWSLEWGGGAQLNGDHVTRDTLKPGDELVVTGNPGRDPAEHRLRVQKIVRPSDGWKWEGVVM